ncbi:MAG: ribonuclease R [Proteobacteria bacterium]|nr:ribonuclease R [Pseudomonadota bacterium]
MKKKIHQNQDPYAKREAEKYEHPIPSREFIISLLHELGRPVRQPELTTLLKLELEEQQEGLRRRLKAMLRDGQLMTDRRGRYCLIDKLNLIAGRVVGHPDGFGFVIPDNGSEDLYLSAQQMRMVLHGDRVLVREKGVDRRGRREGIIVEVIERKTERLVGRYFQEKEVAFVEPDNKRINHDILIPAENRGAAKHGQVVIAQIVVQPTPHNQPIGKITEVLGEHMAPGMEIDVAVRAYELPHIWSDAVSAEVDRIDPKVSSKDIEGRKDCRLLPFVTIDGEDAKDFDDAVFCEKRSRGGWTLYVAIADVSHYVKPKSALDEEAQSRGTSVYFPGRVIPMLPEILSNGLCSLNPRVDRLCMICEMHITSAGKLSNYEFYPAVIHSKARLTYTEVAAMLVDHNEKLQDRYHEVFPHLKQLYALYHVLHKVRQQRGAIDFNLTETQIIFGPDKKIEKIVPVQRNDAHRLIEECMLMANVSTALFLEKNKIPILYRVHKPPSDEKMTSVREFLGELRLQLKGGKTPKPKDYAQLLESVEHRPDAHLIQTIVLYSLSQAEYNPKNEGHFGLAYKAYTHFTSPIRRYPDLLVHRAIKHLLTHKKSKQFFYNAADMVKLGEHCSATERRADQATRDSVAWLKCEYMQDRIGEVFEGRISAVTNFGVFVELKDIYVDGLVHVTSLKNDYYHYDPVKHRLRGERTGVVYRLGDGIRVQVVRVDLDERKIDFELAE